MNAKTDNDHNDTDRQLVLLSEQSNALAAPGAAVEAIGAQLDALFAAGAPGDTLDTIQANALALADTVTQHHAAIKTSLDLAQRIKSQRDATLTALESLKDAIRTCDYTMPEVEALRDQLEAEIMEWQAQTWADDVWDYVIELLGSNGGLDDGEVNRLLDLLNGDGPEPDSDLWVELREWIDRAESDASDERHRRVEKRDL